MFILEQALRFNQVIVIYIYLELFIPDLVCIYLVLLFYYC